MDVIFCFPLVFFLFAAGGSGSFGYLVNYALADVGSFSRSVRDRPDEQ